MDTRRNVYKSINKLEIHWAAMQITHMQIYGENLLSVWSSRNTNANYVVHSIQINLIGWLVYSIQPYKTMIQRKLNTINRRVIFRLLTRVSTVTPPFWWSETFQRKILSISDRKEKSPIRYTDPGNHPDSAPTIKNREDFSPKILPPSKIERIFPQKFSDHQKWWWFWTDFQFSQFLTLITRMQNASRWKLNGTQHAE